MYVVMGECVGQVMVCVDCSWEVQQQVMFYSLWINFLLIVGVVVLVLLVGLGVVFGISLLIVCLLCQVMGVVQWIVEGDFVVWVDSEWCDEVG